MLRPGQAPALPGWTSSFGVVSKPKAARVGLPMRPGVVRPMPAPIERVQRLPRPGIAK